MPKHGRSPVPSKNGPVGWDGGLYEPLSAASPSGQRDTMDGPGDDLLLSGRSQADRGCNRSVMWVCGLLAVAMVGGVGAEVYHTTQRRAHSPPTPPAPAPSSTSGLGPGAGPWTSAPAEAHGLSSAALATAAELVAEAAPQRHCFLVIKDGVIVHERYYGDSNASSKYESDSLGKQGTALLLTLAATKGLIDLDTPLAHYGVEAGAGTWPPNWFAKVTARHLLSQTGGCVTGGNSGIPGYPQCYSPPGTNWTYDSEDFIGHLSKLITKASGMPAVEWATKNYAEVLGLGQLYAEDDAGTDFAAGGGQRMSCRQHARVGQLLANMGAWPVTNASQSLQADAAEEDDSEWSDGEGDGDGTWVQPPTETLAQPQQLISEELCKEILSPQMPNVSKSYGLLTWLGGATADPHNVSCCAPRWGTPGTCSGKKLEGSIIGDDIIQADGGSTPPELRPPLLPTELGLGMGWLGQYMYILPSERLVVVSLGETWGESLQCDGDKANGYDDAFSSTQVWRAFRNATAPKSSDSESTRQLEDPESVSWLQTRHMEDSRRHSLDEAAAESRAAAAAAATASNRGVNADSDGVVESAGSAGAGGGGGSCQCSCPPGRGFGFCFEMPSGTAPNDEACNIVDTTAPKFCPGVGVPKQCHDPPLESDLDCPAVGEHMHGDVGNALVWGGILNCTLRSNCTAPGGDSRFGAASCDCAAWRFGKHGCAWSKDACPVPQSTYFPTLPLSKWYPPPS